MRKKTKVGGVSEAKRQSNWPTLRALFVNVAVSKAPVGVAAYFSTIIPSNLSQERDCGPKGVKA